MKALEDIQDVLRQELPYLRAHYGVDRIGVFGSYRRGEQTEKSDVDLLVTFARTPDLLDFVDLKFYLEDRLGQRVDLITQGALKERMAPRILSEVLYL